MKPAPFRNDLADAPPGGQIVWRRASDGIRLRLGGWAADDAKGTVLLLPGRTEYIEKYGKTIRHLNNAGWAVATLDWRGQGLSDRLDADARLGHVIDFRDYQRDVAELVTFADDAGLPGTRAMIAHSMGGCIGLRTLCNGINILGAVFSAPMWGIEMPAYARPFTYLLPPLARLVAKETRFAPGTKPGNYIVETAFDENMLTNHPDTYDWLAEHAKAAPEFALGGPSIQWVGAATLENNRLRRLPRPNLPVLTFVGSLEKIVSIKAIKRLHANWPSGELRIVQGVKHEVMMEAPPARDSFFTETLSFLDSLV